MKKVPLLLVVLLGACSTGGGSSGTPEQLHSMLHTSLILPAAKSKAPLLFVSDAATAEVYIYQVSTLKVVGTVTGLTQPQGECSDDKGNVWVTDAGAGAIYELSHQGRLENTLSLGYPVGCASDPKTGALAVMSLYGSDGSQGEITVYPKGSGSPRSYTTPKQYYYNFGGYDASGNLFFDGRAKSGTFMLSELPKGRKAPYMVRLSGGTIYFPGMVQWDETKRELVVGDQSCGNAYASCLYTVKIEDKTGTIQGTIGLQTPSGGQVCDLIQGVIYKGELAGSDNDICGSAPSTTYIWPYPAGGAPTRFNKSTDSEPVGAAISP